jgi:peptide/nickel transport system permease protein
MLRFALFRLLWVIPYSWAVITLLFFLFSITGDDPAQLLAGQRSDLATVTAIRQELGLDLPVYQQYLLYLNDLSPIAVLTTAQMQSDNYTYQKLFRLSAEKMLVVKYPYLRRSFQNNRPVAQQYWEKLPGTVILTLSALLFAGILGITMGVLGAVYQDSWADRLMEAFAVLGISVPSYVAAILSAWLLGLVWHEWTGLNVSGYMVRQDVWTESEYYDFSYLILPALTLGLRPLAILYQLTRQSMAEVIDSDFVRTAKAKGLSPVWVYMRHALRNALNPVITSLSVWLGTLLTGAFFIEYIFNWEGIGKLTVEALLTRDYPMLLGSSIWTAMIFVLTALLADLVNAYLDPRLRKG